MLKVLLVEDSPEIQRRLHDLLASVPDVQVVGCADGVAQAMALVEAHHPDVIVLDVALRDGDRGHAVLRQVAAGHPQSQVIVLSNFGWSAMREGFLRAGARAYFDKAFEFRKARDWIARAAATKAADAAELRQHGLHRPPQ